MKLTIDEQILICQKYNDLGGQIAYFEKLAQDVGKDRRKLIEQLALHYKENPEQHTDTYFLDRVVVEAGKHYIEQVKEEMNE